jgi:hypothetical protein
MDKLTVKQLGLSLATPYSANRISSKDSKTGETGYEKDKVTTVVRDIFNESPVHIIHDLSIKFNTLSKALNGCSYYLLAGQCWL